MSNLFSLLSSEKTTVIFQSLNILWKGVLAIAIVITAIYLITFALTTLSAYLEKRKKQTEQIKSEIAAEKAALEININKPDDNK